MGVRAACRRADWVLHSRGVAGWHSNGGKHESSHRNFGDGSGGGGSSYSERSVFESFPANNEEGNQARGAELAVSVQRQDPGGEYAVPGGAARIGSENWKDA